jgi:uncharacterized protein (TIGR02246 family)
LQDFVSRLRSGMGQPKANDQNIAEALQRMVLQMETGDSSAVIAEAEERPQCRACGAQNSPGNRFCARCGVPLQNAPEGEAPPATVNLLKPEEMAAGQHHYHHHYHHHYFAAEGQQPAPANSSLASPPAVRDAARARTPSTGTGFSRAEAAVRKLSRDWVQACNTKHLDDLVDLYAADAMLVRSNVQPIRTAAAIREYFFSALEAGLGDVEMDPLRVELLGEFAYEVGRCTLLVPAAMGKRREERGKYVIVSARQAGEWKVIVDSWSSDLSLTEAKPQTPATAAPRPPVKSA